MRVGGNKEVLQKHFRYFLKFDQNHTFEDIQSFVEVSVYIFVSLDVFISFDGFRKSTFFCSFQCF